MTHYHDPHNLLHQNPALRHQLSFEMSQMQSKTELHFDRPSGNDTDQVGERHAPKPENVPVLQDEQMVRTKLDLLSGVGAATAAAKPDPTEEPPAPPPAGDSSLEPEVETAAAKTAVEDTAAEEGAAAERAAAYPVA